MSSSLASSNFLDSQQDFSDLVLWDTIERSRLNCNADDRQNKFIVAIFTGGLNGVQVQQFEFALSLVIQEFELYYNPGKLQIVVVSISARDVSNSRMTPTQLVDKLLESDVHFILSHIHQSILDRHIGWCMDDVLTNLERLKYHAGFPSGEQLSCPVFTQDKYDYISRISGYSIPTMKILIQNRANPDEFKDVLTR